jgi:hypothetical protein
MNDEEGGTESSLFRRAREMKALLLIQTSNSVRARRDMNRRDAPSPIAEVNYGSQMKFCCDRLSTDGGTRPDVFQRSEDGKARRGLNKGEISF